MSLSRPSLRWYVLAVVIAIGACLATPAAAQEVAQEPSWIATAIDTIYGLIPPAWWTFVGGLLMCAAVVVLFVEAVRSFAPTLAREPGVRLAPRARLVVGLIAIGASQAVAFAGWVTPPTSGRLAVVLAGAVVWALSVVGNEAIFKRIVTTLHTRLGVTLPTRKRKTKPEATP